MLHTGLQPAALGISSLTHPTPRAGDPSPLTLEAALSNLSRQLTLPGDADALQAKAGDAAASLDAANLTPLRMALTDVSWVLGLMAGDVDTIGAAVAAYQASAGPWGDVYTSCANGAGNIKVRVSRGVSAGGCECAAGAGRRA